ncbi:MAG: amidohydrolase [Deltaproteobacteria bacterium]|nr:amidohydrolase [Deltaproteobacteria bacterium]
MENNYLKQAQANIEEIRNNRRDFHKYPELGFKEERTARKVAQYLEFLPGMEVETGIAGTGVVGLLRGGRDGKTAALRADMDALPLQEENNVPYASVNPGVMHACGHDGHTAMLMETARLLSENAENLSGSVKFIFQPCEDTIPSGAEPMIAAGVLEDPLVDAIFTVHLFSDLPQGTLWIKPDYISISSAGFKLVLRGRGGHVGTPHEVVDSIMMAGMLVTNSQALMLKSAAPGDPIIFSFGTIHGGTADNIVPDEVTLTGTIRTATPELRDRAIHNFKRIVKGVTRAAGGDYSLDIELQNPSIYNDPELVSLVKSAGGRVLGPDNVHEYAVIRTGGDDAAFFHQKVPGVYWLLGTRNEEQGFDKPHHNSYYDFDEVVLPLGAAIKAQAVTDFLTS